MKRAIPPQTKSDGGVAGASLCFLMPVRPFLENDSEMLTLEHEGDWSSPDVWILWMEVGAPLYQKVDQKTM